MYAGGGEMLVSGARSTSVTLSTTRPSRSPAYSTRTMRVSSSKANSLTSKRRRRSMTGTTDPRTSSTPSTKAGARGTGVTPW
jgi:hypothetical protein